MSNSREKIAQQSASLMLLGTLQRKNLTNEQTNAIIASSQFNLKFGSIVNLQLERRRRI